MKYIFAIFIIISTLCGCTVLKNTKSEKIELRVLNYGRSSAKLLYTKKDNNMPSGNKRTTDYELTILEHTDTIKLIKDVQFGIEYVIESPTTKPITLTTVWTFPTTMINDLGKKYDMIKYDIEKYTNQYTYSNYTLEADYEMIPGKWNVKIFNKDKMLLDKDFYLIEVKK